MEGERNRDRQRQTGTERQKDGKNTETGTDRHIIDREKDKVGDMWEREK